MDPLGWVSTGLLSLVPGSSPGRGAKNDGGQRRLQPKPYCCRKGRVAVWEVVEPVVPQAVAEPTLRIGTFLRRPIRPRLTR